MRTISSPHNPRIKRAVHLRNRRQREKQGRILIDGVRELGRAVAAGVAVEEVFVCPALYSSAETRRLIEQLSAGPAALFQVSEEIFGRLAFGQRAEGIVGVARPPERTLEELTLGPDALVAVLEGVEKPGNIGAVVRSADGAGFSAVVLADPATDLYNPSAIRASLGTIFCVPVCAARAGEVIGWLRAGGVSVSVARVDGSVPYTEFDFRGPTAVVLGSEAEGVSGPWRGEGMTAVRLPMLGTADSLNVSAAAAVLFYEARRQRGGG